MPSCNDDLSALEKRKRARKIGIAVVIFAVTVVIITTTLVPILIKKDKEESNNGKFFWHTGLFDQQNLSN